MLKSIRDFFYTHLAPAVTAVDQDPQHALRLAVAALLVEVIESDFENSPQERDALLDIVRNHFGLALKEACELVSLAEAAHAESTDYFQFTRLINKTYSPEQKIRVIEDLWRIAFADRLLHSHEEHVIRRLADLIHVSHKDFIAAKHRVLKSL